MTKGDRGYVYVLKLQGSHWYVGSTTNVEARSCEHFAGQGALWTQKHPPLSVVETLECPGGDPLPLEKAKASIPFSKAARVVSILSRVGLPLRE